MGPFSPSRRLVGLDVVDISRYFLFLLFLFIFLLFPFIFPCSFFFSSLLLSPVQKSCFILIHLTIFNLIQTSCITEEVQSSSSTIVLSPSAMSLHLARSHLYWIVLDVFLVFIQRNSDIFASLFYRANIFIIVIESGFKISIFRSLLFRGTCTANKCSLRKHLWYDSK